MINYLTKNFELTDDEKSYITNVINREAKNNAIKNIEYMLSLGIRKQLVGRIVKDNPALLLLDSNPNNNASIAHKCEFYKKYAKGSSLLVLASRLFLYDVYNNSNTVKVLENLQNLGFSDQEMGKLLLKCPKIVSYNVEDSSLNGFNARIDFWQNVAELAEVNFKKLILRSPHLLGYSIDPAEENSIVSKFAYFKNRFSIDDKTLAEQVYKFPNFVGLDISEDNPASVNAKAQKLNELGFSDKLIGENLKILGAPINKVKIRYIICKNFGMSDSSFISNKFMTSETKLYARAMYINNRYPLPASLIYATEGQFIYKTGKSDDEIAKFFPLTKETAIRQEKIFNACNKKQINLSSEELNVLEKF